MLTLWVKFKNSILSEIESDKEEITIGRSGENDIVIDNMAVSGEHAKIIKKKDQIIVVDLKSTNGIFVNEKKIDGKCVLNENDEITIGKHTIVIASKNHPTDGSGVKIDPIERTWKLETERHKKMLKKQP